MSLTRTNEPSGLALTTISPNSSGVCSRPCARTAKVNFRSVSLRAEIDPRDVSYANKRTVRIGPDNDLSEFFRRLQPTLCAHREGKFPICKFARRDRSARCLLREQTNRPDWP